MKRGGNCIAADLNVRHPAETLLRQTHLHNLSGSFMPELCRFYVSSTKLCGNYAKSALLFPNRPQIRRLVTLYQLIAACP